MLLRAQVFFLRERGGEKGRLFGAGRAGPCRDCSQPEREADLTQIPEETPTHASAADIRGVLGALDDEKLLAILALAPTLAEIEDASLWLSGDRDIFGPGRPLGERAGQIVAVLAADEEDEGR